MITITKIQTKPQPDPYHRDTGQATWTALFIDPAERSAYIRQEYDENATPEDVWNGRRLRCRLKIRPDEDAAREYLAGAVGQALLEKIIAGHSIEWDGSNHVGHLSDGAQNALEQLVEDMSDLPESQWSLWTVGDYLAGTTDYIISTDEQLKEYATNIEGLAEVQHIVLAGDVLAYITKIRNEQRAAWLNANFLTPDEIAGMTGMAASTWRNKAARGEITGAVKKGKQWLIPRSAVPKGR